VFRFQGLLRFKVVLRYSRHWTHFYTTLIKSILYSTIYLYRMYFYKDSSLLECHVAPTARKLPTFWRIVAVQEELPLDCLTLNINAIWTFDPSVNTDKSTRRNNPEDCIINKIVVREPQISYQFFYSILLSTCGGVEGSTWLTIGIGGGHLWLR
jgi:hypothetical protein